MLFVSFVPPCKNKTSEVCKKRILTQFQNTERICVVVYPALPEFLIKFRDEDESSLANAMAKGALRRHSYC